MAMLHTCSTQVATVRMYAYRCTILAAITARPSGCGSRAGSRRVVTSHKIPTLAAILNAPLHMQGTICTVCGTTLAAVTAFNISRGIGRRFAERVVDEELKSENEEQSALVQTKFQGVQNAIENGSFAQQTLAVAALRLTPVVPFRFSTPSCCHHCLSCASCKAVQFVLPYCAVMLWTYYSIDLFSLTLSTALTRTTCWSYNSAYSCTWCSRTLSWK